MCDHICRGRSDRKLQFYNRKSGFALPQKYYVMSSCYHIISFAFACDHKRRGRSDRKWQFYSRKNGFALPQKMSSCHHVIMSSYLSIIISSYQHINMSSCHHMFQGDMLLCFCTFLKRGDVDENHHFIEGKLVAHGQFLS